MASSFRSRSAQEQLERIRQRFADRVAQSGKGRAPMAGAVKPQWSSTPPPDIQPMPRPNPTGIQPMPRPNPTGIQPTSPTPIKQGSLPPDLAYHGTVNMGTPTPVPTGQYRPQPGSNFGQPLKKGGKVASASKRADGIAQRGKTRGKMR